ncbi:hypothetical protein GCM10009660_00760 [Catellatospora bangladeshensis]
MAVPEEIRAVRPRLRQDAVFLRSDGGVYLRGGETAFFLRGRTAYRWVSTLCPYLDGGHTVAELCDGLGEAHRAAVVDVIGALLDRGFAVDARPAGEAGLDQAVLARFARQVAYLQHATSGDATGFAAVRAARVRVVGSGTWATAAAVALLRNGVGAVEVAGSGVDERALAAEVAAVAAGGVEATARVLPPGAAPARADVVVHFAEPGSLTGLPVSAADPTPLVPVVVRAGTAVLGPVAAGAEGPCWVCAQLRLASTSHPAEAADLWRELALGVPVRPGAPTSAVVADMLGTAAAFEAFRLLAGLPADTAGAVVQDLETLESTRQRVFPHPGCPRCGDAVRTVDAAEPAAAVDDEARYESLSALVGNRFGVFEWFTDDDLTQVPLKVAGLRAPSPNGLTAGTRELVAVDGTSVLLARIAVLEAAAVHYAGALPDRPDVLTGTADALAAAGHRVLRPSCLDTATGVSDDIDRWVRATSLKSGGTALVPLAAVYPMSAANAARVVEAVPVGAAAGPDADAVVARGLAGALAHRGLVATLRGRAAGLLDPEAEPAGDAVTALLKGFRHLGRAVRVLDLPAAAPAHAVVAHLAGPVEERPLWTIGYGWGRAAALEHALRDLLGTLQLHGDGRAADLGDGLAPDLDPRALVVGPAGARRPDADPAAALADPVGDALLVRTTTADLRAAGPLVSGVVLLSRPGDSERPPATVAVGTLHAD